MSGTEACFITQRVSFLNSHICPYDQKFVKRSRFSELWAGSAENRLVCLGASSRARFHLPRPRKGLKSDGSCHGLPPGHARPCSQPFPRRAGCALRELLQLGGPRAGLRGRGDGRSAPRRGTRRGAPGRPGARRRRARAPGGGRGQRARCGDRTPFGRARALSLRRRPQGTLGRGAPFAARTACRRVPDCGRPVRSPLPPPGPKRRRVLRRAATLASAARIARLSESLGPGVRRERRGRAARRHWGRPRAHQAPPPAGRSPSGGAPPTRLGSRVAASGSVRSVPTAHRRRRQSPLLEPKARPFFCPFYFSFLY